jgi:hypothetical protein
MPFGISPFELKPDHDRWPSWIGRCSRHMPDDLTGPSAEGRWKRYRPLRGDDTAALG